MTEEGGAPGYLEVTITIPPDLMCTTDDPSCQVTVSVIVPPSDDDFVCPSSGERLPQVAVAPREVEEECGVTFDALMWPQGVKVPLAAVVDSLVDGDVTREVQVAVTVSWNSTVEYTAVVGSSEVSCWQRAVLIFHTICRLDCQCSALIVDIPQIRADSNDEK